MHRILTKLIRTLGILLLLSVSALSWAGYKDGESGCRLVLCLANPNGPMSAVECIQDVQELYHQWEKGNPAPPCQEAKDLGTYYTRRNDHYQLCPAGTTDSRNLNLTNTYIVDQNTRIKSAPLHQYLNNPASAESGRNSKDDEATALACVGGEHRTKTFCRSGSGDDCDWVTVHIYQNVAWRPYKASPHVADVYIDNKIFHRARLYQKSAEIE